MKMARTERIQVRFPRHIKEEIARRAAEEGKSEGAIVVQLVDRSLSIDIDDLQDLVGDLSDVVTSLSARIQKLEDIMEKSEDHYGPEI